jgi:hypothetical protein
MKTLKFKKCLQRYLHLTERFLLLGFPKTKIYYLYICTTIKIIENCLWSIYGLWSSKMYKSIKDYKSRAKQNESQL